MPTSRKFPSLSPFLIFFYVAVIAIAVLTTPSSSSSIDTFVFGGCTPLKYIPGSPYDSNLNSLLNYLINSAASTAYANSTVVGSAPQFTIYGLFQCRGDLSSGDCSRCVIGAVSQLGTICKNSCGGALQLEGCFVKYDNKSFFGTADKTVVVSRCGPAIGVDSDSLTKVDTALSYLGNGGGAYRVSGPGEIQAVAQCVGDLSPLDCQDCISDAVGRLRSACGQSAWGDVYLAKCYARFTRGVGHAQPGNNNSNNNNKDTNDKDNDVDKTLAIIIGMVAAVALIILFLTFLNKNCEKRKGGK